VLVQIEPIQTPEDLTNVRARLLSEGLPVEDLGRAPIAFFVARTATGAAVGWGGLEIYGQDALLRSVVVNPVLRSLGAGRAIVEALVGEARARGLERLWLLTQSAQAFFEKLGFEPVSRASAPALIASSEEFDVLSEEDATCMTKAI
jgi:amino-acid N-acetyltransferase